MDELMRRRAEFQVLCQKADDLLNLSVPPDNVHGTLIIKIVVSPSFDTHISWMVFSDETEQDFILKLVRWDRPFDAQRFGNPMLGLRYGWQTEPTITTGIIRLPSNELVVYLTEARTFAPPEEPEHKMLVLDGTRWHVFIAGALGNQDVNWNYEPPEWKDVIAWSSRLVGLFEGLIPTSHDI